jgi:hypothetical protein
VNSTSYTRDVIPLHRAMVRTFAEYLLDKPSKARARDIGRQLLAMAEAAEKKARGR